MCSEVGKGVKRMVASGLKPYDQASVDDTSETASTSGKEMFLAQFAAAA